MKTKKELIKSLEALEENLSPEQIARIGFNVLDAVWDKKLSPEEITREFEAWSDRYVEHKPYGERVKIAFELEALKMRRITYEYFKTCVSLKELAVMNILTWRWCLNAKGLLKQMGKTIKDDIPKEQWEKYLKEHPEDRDLIEGEDELSSLEKQGITEDMLITLQKELCDSYREILGDAELWGLIGYPKPESEFLDDFLELENALRSIKRNCP